MIYIVDTERYGGLDKQLIIVIVIVITMLFVMKDKNSHWSVL